MGTRSRLIRDELSKRAPRRASQVYRAEETTFDIGRALPGWSGHGARSFVLAGDKKGGKWGRGGSGRNWEMGSGLYGRKRLCFHRAQSIWAKVERSVRI
jgi:hypothetical protein